MSKHNLLHYLLTAFYVLIKSLITSLIWIALTLTGFLIYQAHKSPFDLVIGLPLIFAGGGMILNNLGSFALCLFSPRYNKGICPFCSRT